MECFHCKHDNPSGATFCNSCGMRMGDRQADDKKNCVSCGKRMDHDVYFNVCQHCGFAYRISISKPQGVRGATTWTYMMMYNLSFIVPGAGLLIGGMYMSDPGAEKRLGRDCAMLGLVNLVVVALLAYYLGCRIWA